MLKALSRTAGSLRISRSGVEHSIAPFVLGVAFAAFGVGCKNEPAKATTADAGGTKIVGPAPSEIVWNEFVPPGGGSAKPGSADGLPNAAGDAGDVASATGDAGFAPSRTSKVLSPGSEPRQKLRYELKIGRTEEVVATLRPSVTQEMNGQSQSGDQPPFSLTIAMTPKAKLPDGRFQVALKVNKAGLATGGKELPNAKEVAKAMDPLFKALTGLEAGAILSPQGALTELSFSSKVQASPQLQEVLPIVAQAFEVLATPLPDDAVGEGGQWEEIATDHQEGVDATVASTFTLTKRAGNALTVKGDTKRSAPQAPVRDPRAPRGSTMEVAGVGSFTFSINLDGVPQKVEGESLTTVTLRDSSAKPPRTLITKAKMVENVEKVGKGAAP